jgi:hypothetical protein
MSPGTLWGTDSDGQSICPYVTASQLFQLCQPGWARGWKKSGCPGASCAAWPPTVHFHEHKFVAKFDEFGANFDGFGVNFDGFQQIWSEFRRISTDFNKFGANFDEFGQATCRVSLLRDVISRDVAGLDTHKCSVEPQIPPGTFYISTHPGLMISQI